MHLEFRTDGSAYAFSSMLGRYASRTRFVEVVLNGRYQGVYVLMEKLELGPKRVDVEAGATAAEPFLVEKTLDFKVKPDDQTFRLPITDAPVIWTDPERSDMSASEASSIKSLISNFERALYSEGFRDRTLGYRPYLDIPTAVDYVLVNELFKNRDAFDNAYVHGRAGSPLRLGPVWDFDFSSASVPSMPDAERSPEGWIAAGRGWSERLYADPAFMSALAGRWREIRANGLLQRLDRRIQRSAGELRRPAARDFRRWDHPGGYGSKVRLLRTWLAQRTAWLDANLASTGS